MTDFVRLTTVGDLQKFLKDIPPDTNIHTQLIPQEENSGAWNMGASIFFPATPGDGKWVYLRITHRDMRRLSPEFVTAEDGMLLTHTVTKREPVEGELTWNRH